MNPALSRKWLVKLTRDPHPQVVQAAQQRVAQLRAQGIDVFSFFSKLFNR